MTRDLARLIRADVLPVVDCDIVSVIESILEYKLQIKCSGKPAILPEYRGSAGNKQRKDARAILSELVDSDSLDLHLPGSIYETLLDHSDKKPGHPGAVKGRRRVRGIFYTPGNITDFLTASALRLCRIGSDSGVPRILDPACGCGAFLLSAFQELESNRNNRRAGSVREIIAGIHGMDTDADAVHIARLVTWIASGLDTGDFEIMKANIRHGNSLEQFTRPSVEHFDVIISNPPYMNVKRGISPEDRALIKKNFISATGQWDTASLFVELALKHALETGGIGGFILPSPLFFSQNYEPVRRIILENELISFGPAGMPFGGPGVEAGLLLVRKGGSSRKSAEVLGVGTGGRIRKTDSIKLDLINRLPFRIFSHLADSEFLTPMMEAVESGGLARLGEMAEITRGIEIGKGASIVNKRNKEKGVETVSLIAGEDVIMNRICPSHTMDVKKGLDWKTTYKYPGLWKGTEQLLVRRVASCPVAAVNDRVDPVLNTLYILSGNFDRHSLCALINSRIFREIFRQMFAFNDSLFPYVRISQLRLMPIPTGLMHNRSLSRWSKELHKETGLVNFNPDNIQILDRLRKIDDLVERTYAGCIRKGNWRPQY